MAKKPSLPGIWGIHTILKQNYFFKFHDVFLKKSSFCTLADLNHGFGGPWYILWIFLSNATFIMLQKKAFGLNLFWSLLLNWNFFWPKTFLSSIMKVAFIKNLHKMSQGLPNPWFRSAKVKIGYSQKKTSQDLKKYFCFRIVWIPWMPGRVN